VIARIANYRAPSSGRGWIRHLERDIVRLRDRRGNVALLLQVNIKLLPAEIKKLLIETAHVDKGGKAGLNVLDAYLATCRASRVASRRRAPGKSRRARKAPTD
jgi:hypothetical protein